MRFKISLNMPSAKGNLVHQILCDYPAAASLEELTTYLEGHDFVIVEQLYINSDSRGLISNGNMAIHRMAIGKIEELRERP